MAKQIILIGGNHNGILLDEPEKFRLKGKYKEYFPMAHDSSVNWTADNPLFGCYGYRHKSIAPEQARDDYKGIDELLLETKKLIRSFTSPLQLSEKPQWFLSWSVENKIPPYLTVNGYNYFIRSICKDDATELDAIVALTHYRINKATS